MSLRILNIFRQSQTELQVTVYIFAKINCQTNEKPNRKIWKNYFMKLLNYARPLFTVSLQTLDRLAHRLGHTAIMNTLKFSFL